MGDILRTKLIYNCHSLYRARSVLALDKIFSREQEVSIKFVSKLFDCLLLGLNINQ
jgi:hypothetical protein